VAEVKTFPRGTVWRCDCGRFFVSLGMHPQRTSGGGYTAARVEWRPERWWERRRRLKACAPLRQVHGVTGYRGLGVTMDVRFPIRTTDRLPTEPAMPPSSSHRPPLVDRARLEVADEQGTVKE